ncbi:hypothetical protein PPL_11424 [Heterostelium album PN500]|uniref:ELYS-like domain-containing protein n=1 Tax=Heterostelium pallidum (strain ATCC 26659 / Pp 5 / PN500) TaxID=670386 RepID=D3BTD0_HETP5|nr:hypothetical protein PPL_11424 [Heterostelium album PN500]EFA75347.1 hypothetical protein PPL_11424 [Heterostelium album PN500]|eukprot:XP_020427481.1 hypothetical protein PPL_11424 [Heterostelium album PN500]
MDIDEDDTYQSIAVAHSSFDLLLLLDGASITSHTYFNPQDRAIDYMSRNGFLSFVNPTPVYQRFLDSQIFNQQKSSSDPAQQRNELILFALENNMFSLVNDYIQSTTTVTKDYNGNDNISYILSNPKLILDLSWEYFEQLNNNLNFAEIFTQASEDRGRQRLRDRLENVYLRMLDIFQVFECLCDRYRTEYKTEEVTPYLQSKYEAVLSAAQYLEIVKWSSINGLFNPKIISILENLPKVSSIERQLLKDQLASSNLPVTQKDQLLFIDMIYEQMEITESYPPTTAIQLKRFLDLFQTKKFTKLLNLLYYLLLDMDLIEPLPNNILESLSTTFYISESDIAFITGVWYLDSAPLVETDIEKSTSQAYYLLNSSKKAKKYAYWILSRFFIMGGHKNALLFMKSVGFDPKDTKEAMLSVKVLLANDCLVESLLLERNFRKRFPSLEPSATEPLMQEIYNYCLKHRQLDKLMEMPLDDFEDQCFIHYLYKINAVQLVPIYMVRRGRIAEGVNNYGQISRNLLGAGFDGLKSIMLNNEIALPFEQRSLFNSNNQQQASSQVYQTFEDIPLLPRSITSKQQQQQQQSQSQQQMDQSFLFQPKILDKPPTKMFTNTMNLDAKSLDTDSFKDFIKRSTLPQNRPPAFSSTSQDQQMLEQQQHQQQQQQDQMLEEEEERVGQIESEEEMMEEEIEKLQPKTVISYDQDMMDDQEEEEEEEADEKMGEEQQQVVEELTSSEEDIPSPIQQYGYNIGSRSSPSSSSSSSTSSNSTQESPVSSPAVWQPLKSALKVRGTPSSKTNRVNIQESLNIEYPIETRAETSYMGSGSDDEDYDDQDDYDNMHFAEVDENQEEYDEDEEEEEEDDEDLYSVGTRGYGQKNLATMDDFDDDDDEDDDGMYDEEDDMIVHEDVPDQKPIFATMNFRRGGYPQEEQDDYEEEEDDDQYDDEYDEEHQQRLQQTGGSEEQPFEIVDSDEEESAAPKSSQQQQFEKEEQEDDESDSFYEDEDEIETTQEDLSQQQQQQQQHQQQQEVQHQQQQEQQIVQQQQQDSFMNTDTLSTSYSGEEKSMLDEINEAQASFQIDTSSILTTDLAEQVQEQEMSIAEQQNVISSFMSEISQQHQQQELLHQQQQQEQEQQKQQQQQEQHSQLEDAVLLTTSTAATVTSEILSTSNEIDTQTVTSTLTTSTSTSAPTSNEDSEMEPSSSSQLHVGVEEIEEQPLEALETSAGVEEETTMEEETVDTSQLDALDSDDIPPRIQAVDTSHHSEISFDTDTSNYMVEEYDDEEIETDQHLDESEVKDESISMSTDDIEKNLEGGEEEEEAAEEDEETTMITTSTVSTTMLTTTSDEKENDTTQEDIEEEEEEIIIAKPSKAKASKTPATSKQTAKKKKEPIQNIVEAQQEEPEPEQEEEEEEEEDTTTVTKSVVSKKKSPTKKSKKNRKSKKSN